MVHVVLAVISLVMGTAIGWLGWKGLKAHREALSEAQREAAERLEPSRQG
jgi:hypothetical protein